MKLRQLFIASAMVITTLAVLPGCAVTRGQSTVGEYIDDATISTTIRAKYVDSKTVDATSVKVETLNGEVIISGFARNAEEKARAEQLALEVKGVRRVKNAIEVRK
jgi:hyperosmotically inducible protein